VVEKLNGYMRELVADAAAVKRLSDLHIDPMSMTADEFATLVKADAVKWERVVREAGAKVQ
jgi:tripartite-type tricarboxylate transporter receptor subunit TctC